MSDADEECETFIFFREGFFYPVEIPPSQVQANVDLNPGTLMVMHAHDGHIVWSPPLNGATSTFRQGQRETGERT